MSETPIEETPQPQEGTEPKEAAKTTFDAAYVKKLRDESAKHRTEAKANADKAKAFDDLQEQQKTEAQKQADQIAQAQRETEQAKVQNLQLTAMLTHGIPVDYQDMLGHGDADEINARAEKLGALLKAKTETERTQSPGRPQVRLHPGATPADQSDRSTGQGGISEAQKRFGIKQ